VKDIVCDIPFRDAAREGEIVGDEKVEERRKRSSQGGPGVNRRDPKLEAYLEREAIERRMSKVKHRILVLSGKGGVGKSTVACHLALSLARAGKRVGLLDVDIHGPSIPKMLGLEGRVMEVTAKTMLPVGYGKNLKVMSMGFLLQSDQDAVIWRGPLKMGAIKQFIKDVEWGPLDYLIIDSPPGTGDEPLSICQLIPARQQGPLLLDGALIVTTPQELSLVDVKKSISFCRKLEMPVLGVVENMSGFICPKCGEETQIFKSGGGERMAREMGVPFLGGIPIDPRIVSASDSGQSYLEMYPDSAGVSAFNKTIQPILDMERETVAAEEASQ
jgi:ATP-binding protein involved in chromosome partitioning